MDYLPNVKLQQQNWIGKSTGAFVNFAVKEHADEKLRIYTTRPDTLYGVTFMVIAPEHPLSTVGAPMEGMALACFLYLLPLCELVRRTAEQRRTAKTKK